MDRMKIPPYAAFFVTLLLLLPVHLLIPLAHPIRFPYTLIGIAISVGGVALGTRHRGGMYTDQPESLITDGPYRFTRNPLYLGMVLITLGIAVLLGSLGALLLVAVEVVVMNFWGIPYEEHVLSTAFAEEYAEYRRRVRRWI